uniref:GP70 n=1 Tax=Caviid herpesvirus 2 str. CIDMTR TaxID=1415526 RepID=U6H6D5_9BETA|nr:GP70 [Caviid herpesvirus 2 str. CIDMTR]
MTEVFFATEYDAANIIVNILSKTPTDHLLFPLIVKYRPSTHVLFCLQTQKCSDSSRIGTVFVCDGDGLDLSRYVCEGSPIPAHVLSAVLDEERTKPLYSHLTEEAERVLANNAALADDGGGDGAGGRARPEFKHLVYFSRTRIIRYLNTTFLTPNSPAWFMSTFGPTEGMLLLAMSYYLFERQCSTVQTTRDYVRCFVADTGAPILTYISMADLSRTLLASRFRGKIARFAEYAKRRNARDRRELAFVDRQIDRFRQEAKLPDATCVHYIYLAYRTALHRERILTYCDAAAYDPDVPDEDQCTRDELCLGRYLDQDLLSTMERYFSPEGFFDHYVDRVVADVRDLDYTGYRYDAYADSTAGYFGSSHALDRMLTKINRNVGTLFDPIERSVSGLLEIASSGRVVRSAEGPPGGSETLTDRRHHLFPDLLPPRSGPLPVFRVEIAESRHVFCCLAKENWARRMFPKDFFSMLPDEALSDEALTDAVWTNDDAVASPSYQTQLFRTRHEFFNARLPVFNFVGDLDLKLRDSGASARRCVDKPFVFDLCRALRRVIVRSWARLFGTEVVEQDYHPVFFFKTACRDDDDDADGGGDVADEGHHRRFGEMSTYASLADIADNLDEDELRCFEERRAALRYADLHPSPVDDAGPNVWERNAFCRCREKIGIRVIAPFPPGYALSADAVRTLATFLNHLMGLDAELVRLANDVVHLADAFDTGIYHTGRTVRLPFMYKLDRESGYIMHGRLNPLIVVPPARRQSDCLGFVRDQTDVRNLLHHSQSRASMTAAAARDRDACTLPPPVTVMVVRLYDTACRDSGLTFMESKAMQMHRGPRNPELLSLVAEHMAHLNNARDLRSAASPVPDGNYDAGVSSSSSSSSCSSSSSSPPPPDDNDRFGVGRSARSPGGDPAQDLVTGADQNADQTRGDDDQAPAGRGDARIHFSAATKDTLRRFVRTVAWPPIRERLLQHYESWASEQFAEHPIVFNVSNPTCVQLKRLVLGFAHDFYCISRQHRNRQQTVQFFIDLRTASGGVIWAILWSRCFTTRCKSNSKQTHISIKIDRHYSADYRI